MKGPALASRARELQQHLDIGVLTTLGRVELSDGVTVDAERMARIVLSDGARVIRGHPSDWLTVREQRDLQDDLMRLLILASAPVRA